MNWLLWTIAVLALLLAAWSVLIHFALRVFLRAYLRSRGEHDLIKESGL